MANASEDEEDDYLSMTFAEPAVKETSLQRTVRLKKEAAERSRIPSKKERAEREREARDAALATELDASNKGARMMAKMGFKGGALGQTEDARTQPIELVMKEDRGGIGMDAEKKRKLREAAAELESQEKRRKVDVDEYRERTRAETEERRTEGQMWSAMRTLEDFETGDEADATTSEDHVKGDSQKISPNVARRPLSSINILWRPLVKQRLEKDRERRMRYDLEQSLSRKADYGDADVNDDNDKLAFDDEIQDLDDEDPQLDEFESLSFSHRLEKIVKELREKYYYCFWCKYRYPGEAMDGCPGLTEDEHG